MNTKTKLALLELTTGILGWLWIGASLAAIYFFVMAIGFDRLWSPFFWSVGISVVAKWLARGFRDTQLRVDYESQLVERSYSKEEARQAWATAYSGGANKLAEIQSAHEQESEPKDAT